LEFEQTEVFIMAGVGEVDGDAAEDGGGFWGDDQDLL
jgi:hypothetical protein